MEQKKSIVLQLWVKSKVVTIRNKKTTQGNYMAHDEKLNQRIREVLKGKRGITEKNMFGGLCFFHHGNMLCGADFKNGLMVRVGPGQYEKVLQIKHARKMDITGVPMKGLIFVDSDGYKTKSQLEKWIEYGLVFTKTLQKKKK